MRILLAFRNFSIATKLAIPMLIVAVTLAITSFVVINNVQRKAAETQAAKSASAIVNQMIATRSAYTANVVGKLKGDNAGVGFATDFASREGFAPLPATLVHKISDLVNADGSYTIDLISPWPINKDKSPGDDWELLAVDALIRNPDQPFFEIQKVDDRETLRFAATDFAGAQACVTCHNNHPDSPRDDFELGEIMGALVVDMPVDEEFATASSSAMWIASGAVTGLTLLVMVAMFAVRVWVSRPIGRVVIASTALAEGDSSAHVEVRSRDELGRMAEAFNRISVYNSEMADAATTIADGDLTVEVVPKSEKDELGIAFSTMVSSLGSVVSSVREAAMSVASSSVELEDSTKQVGDASRGLAEVSQQLAEGSSNQASSMKTAVGFMETLVSGVERVRTDSNEQVATTGTTKSVTTSLSSSISDVVKDAQAAQSNAAEANKIAANGLEVVSQTVEGMDSIQSAVISVTDKVTGLGDKSTEIGKIVSVIDEIAAQTNLLALNAAIEAARAGEQGRGFAVVADEVRQLAERVTTSTTEIADLVRDLQGAVQESITATGEATDQVEAGSKLVVKTGDVLKQIIDAVEGITQQMSGVADAATNVEVNTSELVENMDIVDQLADRNASSTTEMTESATETSEAISEISIITDSNSALAEEVSASTEELMAQVDEVVTARSALSGMADKLDESMSKFKMNSADTKKKSRSDRAA